MKPRPQPISVEEARSTFEYDPATGVIVRRKSYSTYAGKPAGFVHHGGYVVIKIGSRQVLAHRLAWFLFHGFWPAEFIDHINRDKTDNRISNLREANNAQNVANSRARAASGFKGVYRQGKKWTAQVNINGKTTTLGFFDDPVDASNAYAVAASALYGEFVRLV